MISDPGPGESVALRKRCFAICLNLAASIHVAWFYVACVPSGLDLPRFEQGLERTPFQHRLLMMFPLRWAHRSSFLNHLSGRLSAMPAWFPHGVRPEGIFEAVIDLLCIVVAGLVARDLYRGASPTRLLTPYIYPLTLLMIAATFCFNTMHRLRFVFDLPSMAFFAVGLWLIYFRRSSLLFAALFLLATINRETTLFLLLLYLLRELVAPAADARASTIIARLPNARTGMLLLSLSAFWIVWHLWVARHFRSNPTAAGPRFWLNIGTLLWPFCWSQILCTAAFCAPLCLAGRRLVQDRVLRAWFVLLPVWFVFMLRYGILIETRVFGELIPYLACVAALVAEHGLIKRIKQQEVQP